MVLLSYMSHTRSLTVIFGNGKKWLAVLEFIFSCVSLLACICGPWCFHHHTLAKSPLCSLQPVDLHLVTLSDSDVAPWTIVGSCDLLFEEENCFKKKIVCVVYGHWWFVWCFEKVLYIHILTKKKEEKNQLCWFLI